MAWTDEMVEQLKQMWQEGLTTGEIGKRLNVSKNSIVGKVHRLGLSGRPSPIKKKDEEAEKKPQSPAKATAPKTGKAPAPKEEKKVAPTVVARETSTEVLKKAAPERTGTDCATPRNTSGLTMLTDLDNHTCRWPIGDPKDDNFHFCGKKIKIGQTYCEEHAAVAYVKTNKK